MIKLIHGDCLDKLKEFKDNSIDSIVTDPPYGLSFMGKKWDYDVPSQEIFAECLRVIKPGGHILAFAGSRTYHRMAVRIEDAGFEIRDQIMWIYGSGFPKSHNIGKAVDKLTPRLTLFKPFAEAYKKARKKEGLTHTIICEKGKFYNNHNHGGASTNWEKGYNVPTKDQWKVIKPLLKMSDEWSDLIERVEKERQLIGKHRTDMGGLGGERLGQKGGDITKGNSPYEGWGTALKPAHEPIVMARKPFKGTVVNNVLEWGTGGINIDDSRIGIDPNDKGQRYGDYSSDTSIWRNSKDKKNPNPYSQTLDMQKGRFPANIILDKEAGKILDEQSGNIKSPKSVNKYAGDNTFGGYKRKALIKKTNLNYNDNGGASRFFYCPKTSKKDRNEGLDEFSNKNGTIDKNIHPTVKPTDLMLYLIRLVTPQGGTTLDPFMGSGSTGKAAIRGGFDFIGIDREIEYMNIAQVRIKYEQEQVKKLNAQKRLF